ncbi:MAG: hypothetical protein EOP86_28480 [Verrucomicrobiaceae bacterium]|nr:MAG: hypothetical protein EOP86_28480 [Verrucomicrobiaceae bacterium]
MKSTPNPVSSAGDGIVPDRRMFSALLEWRIASDTAAGPQGAGKTCAWLSSLAQEGYRVDEDSISLAVYTYGKADPAAAFQWLIDIAGRTRTDPEQSRQLIRRQGTVAHQWAKADPEGLSRWLVAQPSQPGYENGAFALYHQLKDTDPAAAAAWGQVVTDPDMQKYLK